MNENVQIINLDDYIQTGEGGTALTYTRKDGRSLAKLYNPGFEADTTRLRSYKQGIERFYREKNQVPQYA